MSATVGTVIVTATERSDVAVSIAAHDIPRAVIGIGNVCIYCSERGTLTAQLDAVEAIGREIVEQVAAHRARLAHEAA